MICLCWLWKKREILITFLYLKGGMVFFLLFVEKNALSSFIARSEDPSALPSSGLTMEFPMYWRMRNDSVDRACDSIQY